MSDSWSGYKRARTTPRSVRRAEWVSRFVITLGGFGTILSQNAWLPVFRTLGVRFWAGGRLMASRAGSLFDDGGNLVDERMRDQLASFMRGFSEFIGPDAR